MKMDESFIKDGTEIVQYEDKSLTKSIEKVNSDLPKYWDRDYIVSKISNMKNQKHKALMQFLWMTGVRISEAVNVYKKDIDFEHYTVLIKWQKSKVRKYRKIPLHPNLREFLGYHTSALTLEDRVFPITRVRAWQIVQRELGGNPHMLRHFFAVNWLRCGGRFEILSKMLGHSDIKTTMVYLDIVPIDQGKELLKIKF
jgi:integrase/recombinase XerD